MASCSVDRGITRLAAALSRANLAFLFGAGVSVEYPSLLPLAASGPFPGLIDLVFDALVRTADVPEAEKVRARLQSVLLEEVLDHLHRVLGDRAFEFLAPLRSGQHERAPNFRHRALALLAEFDSCRRFITVNFDTLFEDVCSKPLYCPEKQPDEAAAYDTIKAGDERCLLLKLHGTIERPQQLLTTVELVAGGLPLHKATGLRHALEGHSVCFLGYRDSDLDVFPTIRRTTAPDYVAWYEYTSDGSRPYLPDQVKDFLQTREHMIYSGHLDVLLDKLLIARGIAARDILTSLGSDSIGELLQKDLLAWGSRGQELTTGIAEIAKEVLSPSAASLVLCRMAGPGRDPGTGLLRAVNRDDLNPIGLSAYWSELAERAWKQGRFPAEVRYRRWALRAVGVAETSPTTRRWSLEYRLKLAWSHWHARRSRGGVFGLISGCYHRAVVLWSLRVSKLDAYSRGSTRSMIIARRGRFAYKAGLSSLTKGVHAVQRGRVITGRCYQLFAQCCLRLALTFYRKGRQISYQSQGWLRMHLQGLGQTLLHLQRSPTDEAIAAIEADAVLGANPEQRGGPRRPHGLPAVLVALYDNNVEATARELAYTWWYYRRASRYLGGVRETYQTFVLARHRYGEELVRLARRYYRQYSRSWEAGEFPPD